jgi:RNA recognition motif-containing protein
LPPAALQILKECIMYKIFVGNISFRATEDSVRSLFAAYGGVESVNIMRDRDTGQPRGFGFVEMTNASEGRRAICGLDNTDFEGRTLHVSEARPKEDRAGFGDDRRGSRGQRGFHRY